MVGACGVGGERRRTGRRAFFIAVVVGRCRVVGAQVGRGFRLGGIGRDLHSNDGLAVIAVAGEGKPACYAAIDQSNSRSAQKKNAGTAFPDAFSDRHFARHDPVSAKASIAKRRALRDQCFQISWRRRWSPDRRGSGRSSGRRSEGRWHREAACRPSCPPAHSCRNRRLPCRRLPARDGRGVPLRR